MAPRPGWPPGERGDERIAGSRGFAFGVRAGGSPAWRRPDGECGRDRRAPWQQWSGQVDPEQYAVRPVPPPGRDSAFRWAGSDGPPLSRRGAGRVRSEEHTSELQSRENLVCRLLLEKKNKKKRPGESRN